MTQAILFHESGRINLRSARPSSSSLYLITGNVAAASTAS